MPIVNFTIITIHRWLCLKNLPIDIWFYLQDSRAARFVISDLHSTDLPYAKRRSRSTAELEGCVILFSKRDLWRPTGDLQNLSRSFLKLISSVQCIYCISQAHNQDFALQVIIPYKHIWDLLPDLHRSLCRQSGTNEFPEGPSDEWKCTMTVRGEAWTSTCHIIYRWIYLIMIRKLRLSWPKFLFWAHHSNWYYKLRQSEYCKLQFSD